MSILNSSISRPQFGHVLSVIVGVPCSLEAPGHLRYIFSPPRVYYLRFMIHGGVRVVKNVVDYMACLFSMTER